jgi:hypothetical protein
MFSESIVAVARSTYILKYSITFPSKLTEDFLAKDNETATFEYLSVKINHYF